MALMKKDMGGAAAAMALAAMIMGAKLPVRLRLLIPAVENAIAGNAFRPGDVLRSRKGLSVEIGNTDARAASSWPTRWRSPRGGAGLIVDFATLTGAARVALGPDLPPFFTHDEKLAADLARLARRSTIPPGGCRSGRPMGRSSTRRLRM
jgi:leucyl aminopeptidase